MSGVLSGVWLWCRFTARNIKHPGEEVVTLQAAIPSLSSSMHNAYPRWVGNCL